MSSASTRASRRLWLQRATSTALATPMLGHVSSSALWAQEAPLVPLNRFGRMVHEHFVAQVRAAEQRGQKRKQAIQSKADAEGYVTTVRQLIRECFGPEPERTPLNARVTGELNRDAYKIEKVVFESRPGFYVTANLYLPKGGSGRRPAVVASCGHSTTGKAEAAYQSFAQGLARMGYVVLIFDPIGQGERLQYTDAQLKPRRGVGVPEHLHAGNQQFLVGEFFGAWRAWDGIRALDYLLTRPEVDPLHVGITGNSGGGTMTTWLCGLDRRWTMAAPGCFVTTFRRNMENELPADTEQCPPQCLRLGLDHDDFLAAMAPRPVIILAKERDYFDVRGSQEAYERLRHVYSALGAADNVQLQIGPTGHGYTQENREAMYRFFNSITRVSDLQTEPDLKLESDQDLLCTPQGQVAGLNSRTVMSFTQERSRALAQSRSTVSGNELLEKVRTVLRVPQLSSSPDYRILRPLGKARQYLKSNATAYAVETEPGVQAIVSRLSDEPHFSRPTRGNRRATLYIAHQSSDAELRGESFVKELVEAEPLTPFFACDVRGIGESRPDTCGGGETFRRPYGSDYFYAIHSIMLDRPYLGQKVFDVLSVLSWLRAEGHTHVHLCGMGWGAIPAAFAALLSDQVVQVTLKQSLASYSAVAESDDYDWPLSSFVPGGLAHFDLPEVYAALKVKQLRQIDPVGAVVPRS